MTDAPERPAARQTRPARPPRPWKLYGGLVLFLAVTWLAGGDRFGIGLSFGEIAEGLSRGNRPLQELMSPDWEYLPRLVGPFVQTLQMAVIASILGCGLALPASFLASRVTAPSPAVFQSVKTLLNVIRSMPDLLYAMVFVAALSIGPLPGILALILFNIGVTAKLTSETIDAVDVGPLEAAHASGARHLSAVRSAVLPQVLPNYIAYALYVFELNLRASAVLGIVGAGGIGQPLEVARAGFRYDRIAVIVIGLFVVVFVVERVSMGLRRRLV